VGTRNTVNLDRRTLLGGAGLLMAAPRVARAAAAKPKVTIKTAHGSITVELEDRKAPLTSTNFLRYVDGGKYDGGNFFRAVRTRGAPKQGDIVADMNPHAHPYPPIAHESTTTTGLRHETGTISLGRYAPGSATSTFFICASPEPSFDAHPGARGDNLGYAAFGRVIAGMAVVRTILSLHTSQDAKYADQKGQWLDPAVPIVSMHRSA
jgi:peptidyl-prolyl cis-trans isomerase A (cyclophilin A)